MHKQVSNLEKLVGKSWLARQLNIQPALVHYYAIKLRLRDFKYGGVRYISADDIECLLLRLQFQYNLADDLLDDVRDKINT